MLAARQENHRIMKNLFVAASLVWACAAAAGAAEPAPAPAAAADLQNLAARVQDAQDELADLRKRVAEIEDRLGETYRPVTPFDTVERRLDDLEKDVEDLKRR